MPSNYALGAAPDAEVISDARGNKILSWASGPIPFLLRVPVGTKLYALTPAQYAALSHQPEAQGVVDEAMAQRFLKALPELYAHDAPPVSAVMLGLTAALTGERNVC